MSHMIRFIYYFYLL